MYVLLCLELLKWVDGWMSVWRCWSGLVFPDFDGCEN